MLKQIFLPIIGVALFVVVVGLLVKSPEKLGLPKLQPSQASTSVTKKVISFGSLNVNVELADTPNKRTQGLSGRKSLDPNSGMLFAFETKQIEPTFWMKDMLFPLDIIWISNGKIIKIDKNLPIPSPGTTDDELSTYSANKPVDYVLEVNSGFAAANNIKVGGMVDLSKI